MRLTGGDRSTRFALFAAGLLLVAFCRRTDPPPAPAQPLRIGLYAPPAGLDPHRHNEFVTFTVVSNLFEGLTSLDPSLQVRPALAESWSSPEDDRWRFQLRPGVSFHDGRALTSSDVVFSLERARTHPRSEFGSYLVTAPEDAARVRRTWGPRASESEVRLTGSPGRGPACDDVDLEFRDDLRADEIARQLGEAGIRVRPRPTNWQRLLKWPTRA